MNIIPLQNSLLIFPAKPWAFTLYVSAFVCIFKLETPAGPWPHHDSEAAKFTVGVLSVPSGPLFLSSELNAQLYSTLHTPSPPCPTPVPVWDQIRPIGGNILELI